MPMYKMCARCGKLISIKDRYCDACRSKEEAYHRLYKTVTVNQAFYESMQWRNLAHLVRRKFFELDVYAWYLSHGEQMVKSEIVHHIIPIKDDENLKMTEDNLIPLSRRTHEMVERYYSMGEARKRQTQSMLRKAKVEFQNAYKR